MKPVLTLYFLALLPLCFTSCNQKTKTERLKRIDSLGVFLNHVGEVVAAFDSAEVTSRVQEIDKNSLWVFDNVTDTLDSKPGIAFGDYIRTKKFFGKAMDRYRVVKRELAFSTAQLANLREDVENGFYTNEEFRGHFKSEAESVAKLTAAADELTSKYETADGQYQRVKPQVASLLDSIKSVIYASKPHRP